MLSYAMLALLFALYACAGGASMSMEEASSEMPTGEPAATIGEALMKPDGTIVLLLRAEGPGALQGDALIEYSSCHPQYQRLLRHLGGLKPGEKKPVPSWPDVCQ